VIAVVALVALCTVVLSACSGGSNDEYEQQISDLEAQLSQTEAQLESSQAEVDSTQAELETTQAELDSTSADLAASQRRRRRTTQAELETAQAELLDAQAQLARAGELVLKDGTYNGPVLAAKVTPYRVILFDSTGAWRIAQVADDARITSGGRTLTLGQFAKLLQSNDPADINLVNGFYRVTVRQGLVTTLRKSTS
jgi:multidrug efflux pump subunit AcrA (membrane-fusion protein)